MSIAFVMGQVLLWPMVPDAALPTDLVAVAPVFGQRAPEKRPFAIRVTLI